MIRIGQSTDIHRFKEGDFLVIGGEKISAPYGVVAHSDGDALIHAISEAVLGAVGLRDLGYYFSDKDPKWKNANSIEILKACYEMANEKGYFLGNIDSLVIIESVKMASHIEKIKENIASALNVDVNLISVKATRGEKLGFIGNNEGYAAQAVVLMNRVS